MGFEHNNRKELIYLKDEMDEKRHTRKINFTEYLYGLKFKFLAEEDRVKTKRIEMIANLRK